MENAKDMRGKWRVTNVSKELFTVQVRHVCK